MPVHTATRAVVTQLPSSGPRARRRASTTPSAYPYPAHPRPTPHQIFHLAPGATQEQVKARYYELVRQHHPDAPACRHVTAAERHARFQSIGAAYDTLRGRRAGPGSSTANPDAFEAELARRRRNARAHSYAHRDWGFDFPGDGGRHGEGRAWDASDPAHAWKDRALVLVGGLALLVGLYPMLAAPFNVGDKRHRAAVANLREARAEAREHGQERRAAIRERVEEDRERRQREEEMSEEERRLSA